MWQSLVFWLAREVVELLSGCLLLAVILIGMVIAERIKQRRKG